MLVKLTPKEEVIKIMYEDYLKVFPDVTNLSFEDYLERFTEVDDIEGFYLDQNYRNPKMLSKIYDGFTQEGDPESLLENIGKVQIGFADNYDQIKEYYKEEIEDPDKKWIILINLVFYNHSKPEEGLKLVSDDDYIGEYKQFKESSYYNSCEFGEDYQGYLIRFRIVPII